MKLKPGDELKVRVLSTNTSGITEIEVEDAEKNPERFCIVQLDRPYPRLYPIKEWRENEAALLSKEKSDLKPH